MKFRYFGHTSEAKFRAYGNNLEKVFENAGLALINLVTDVKKIVPRKKIKIKVASEGLESLLFDFLERVIFIMQVKGVLGCRFSKMKIFKRGKRYKLECVLVGDSYKNYKTKSDVKSVTYNQILVGKNKKGYYCQIVVDV